MREPWSCLLRCSATLVLQRCNAVIHASVHKPAESHEKVHMSAGFDPSFRNLSGNTLLLFQNQSNLTVENSQLNNLAYWQDQSVINFTNCAVYISDLNSNNCSMQYVLTFSNEVSGQDTGSVFVEGSTFFNATGSASIYIDNGNITVSNSVFSGGSATAIWRMNGHDDSVLKVVNCDFASIWGNCPVVFLRRSVLRLTYSNFYHCQNTGELGLVSITSYVDVGVSINDTVLVDHCVFAYNYAQYGAFYMLGWSGSTDLQTPTQTINVFNSNFFGNSGSMGGAMTMWAVPAVNIQGCRFEGNSASFGLGGALYVYGWQEQVTYFTMRGSKFVGSNATALYAPGAQIAGITDHEECGGALISSFRCAGISDSMFANNSGVGLCIHGQDTSAGSCEGSDPTGIFFNRSNVAGVNASGFINDYLGLDHSIDMTVNVMNSDFVFNEATLLTRVSPDPIQPIDPLSGGAALSITFALFSVLSGLTVQSNLGRQGSALHLDSCNAAFVWNSTFSNNTATNEGGAIATISSHGHGLLLANSTVKNNLAVEGGAVYGDSGASITICNGTQLDKNRAIKDGGGVYCDSCNLLKLSTLSKITSNQAHDSGGGCYCSQCVLFEVSQIELTNNRCDLDGLQMVQMFSVPCALQIPSAHLA